MNSQVTPDQVQQLLALNALVLFLVTIRPIGLTIWNRYFKDQPADELSQEERDELLVRRRRRK